MSEIKLACDVVKQVRAICDKHGNQPGELINILHEAQHLHGYLPEEMQRIITSAAKAASKNAVKTYDSVRQSILL